MNNFTQTFFTDGKKKIKSNLASLVLILTLMLGFNSFGQNAIVGTGFSTGWGGGSCSPGNGNFKYLATSAGTSYGVTSVANSTGNQYFRFGVDWGGTTAQLAITPGTDTPISANTTYTLNTSCTTSGSQIINVGSTSYNYVFKTLNAGTAPTGKFVFFEVQGAVQSISSIAQSPASNVPVNMPVTVNATLSGAFSVGQAAYLRYTTDAWATSTVVQMTGSGIAYSATIPGQASGKAVAYYAFTSGTANVASNGSNADLYSINFINNGGSNYPYTVTSTTANVWVTSTGGTGSAGAGYTTLQGAVTAINGGAIHTGDINVAILANTTETAAIVLNSSGATASYTSIKIFPGVDGVTVSGPTVTGRGLLELNGADNVTIDGDNPATSGINRNLTFTNTAASTITYASVIRLAAYTSIITSSDNNIIKNCNINGNATGRNASANTSTSGSENTSYGIYAGATVAPGTTTTAPSAINSTTTAIGSGATFANLLIDNNAVNACARAIMVQGSAATVATGLIISNNLIGASTPAQTTTVYSMGISAQGSSNGIIKGNTIRSVESYLAATLRGIDVGSISSNAGDQFTIDSNYVYNIVSNSASGYGAFGINLNGGAANVVKNNFIYAINAVQANSNTDTSFGPRGIRINTGTNHKIYNNTVSLSGAMLAGSGSPNVSACLTVTGTSITGCDVRNNIFSNTQSGIAASVMMCVQLPSGGTSAMSYTENNNAYYTGAGTSNYVLGTTTPTFYSTANFVAATTSPATNARSYTSTLSAAGTNDSAAFASTAAAPFVSATDLHISTGSTPTGLESGGAAVGVSVDIDGQTRPGPTTVNGGGIAPDMGADEFDGVPLNLCTTPTAQPTALTFSSVTTTTLSGSFTAASPVPSGYIVIRSTSSTLSGNPVDGTTYGAGTALGGGTVIIPTGVTFTDSALTAGTKYYYFILSYNSSTCTGGPKYFSTSPLTNNVVTPCTAATSLAATLINPTGTTLTWTGAGNYIVEYGAAGFTPGTGATAGTGGTVASSTATTPYVLTGLTTGTSYDVYVRQVCAISGYSANSTKVTFTPTCSGTPTGLGSSAITTTTATISWTAASPAPASGYEYYVSTSSTTPLAGATATGSVGAGIVTANLTGLSASSTYYYWVRSNCDGTNKGTWSASATFATTCGAISSFPWSENFDSMPSIGSAVVPNCWLNVTGTNAWTSSNAASNSYNDPRSTPNYMTLYYNSTPSYLWTPGFALTAGTSYDFSYYFVGDAYSGWTGDVLYNTTQSAIGVTALGSSFITTATTSSTSYAQVKRTFVAPTTGTYYFAVRVSSNTTPYYLGVDDFNLSVTPSPITITPATSTTFCNGGSVALTASSAATYTYAWSPATGLSSTSGTTVTASPSTTTTYTVTGTGTGASAGMTTTQTVVVTVNPAPTAISLTPSTATSICPNTVQSIVATEGPTNLVTDGFNGTASQFGFYQTAGTYTYNLSTGYYAEGTGAVLFSTASTSASGYVSSLSNIDLTNSTSATLTFKHICGTEAGYDYGYVEYSTDGGATYTTFPTSSYAGAGTLKNSVVSFDKSSYTDWGTQFTSSASTPGVAPATSLFKSETINIPTAALASNQFRVRFRYTTDLSNDYYGWLLDDIKINSVNKITWSPATGLYTDAAATTTPYVANTNATTVYVKSTMPGTTTYTATATVGSCTATKTVDITIKTPVAITSATAAASPICSSATTTLTANGVAGTNAVVTWYTGAGGTGSNLGTGTTLVAGPGTYYARVTGDCGTAVEASVTVGAKVNVGITSVTPALATICSSGTTTLTANGVVGTNAVVTWYTGAGGTGSNLGTGTTSPAVGLGTYYARVTGDCGTAEASATVNSYGTPWGNLQYPSSGSICATGGTLTAYGQVYLAGVTPGAGVQGAGITAQFGYSTTNTDPSTWTNWTAATFNSSGGGANNDEYMYTFTPPAAGTYYYTYRYNYQGCNWFYGGYHLNAGGAWDGTTNVNGTLTVTAPPVAGTLSGTQGICTTGTSTFTSTVPGGSWTSSNTSVATINSSTGVITPLTAGTSTMTYTVTGTGGCSNATATLLLTVTAPPVAGTLSGTQGICTTGTSTFTSTVPGGSWTSSNTSVATINSSTGVITPLTAGTSTMTYTVAGAGGCSNATATLLLTVTAPPVAGTLSGTQSICTTTSGSSFSSTVTGGSWTSSNTSVATINSSTGVITPLTAGTSTMTYTVTGTGGCSNATATLLLTVTAPPVAGTLSGTQGICTTGTSTFTSTVTGGSWTSSNTSVATINSSTGVITPLTAGTSTMTYTVTGAGGCSNATATLLLTVTAPPVAGTLSGTQSICTTTSGSSFSSTVTGGSWTSSNTSVATINSSTGVITPLTAGTSTMTYTVTGTGGCSNATATLLLTVTAPPVAGTLSGTQGICTTGTSTFTSTVTGGSWTSSNTSVATINSSTGVITPLTAGTSTMTYTVTGAGGCSNATATLLLTVTAPPVAGTLSGTQGICTTGTSTFTSTVTGGSWTSSNTSVATINSSTGVITPLTAGTSTMTYTVTGTGGCSNATATLLLTVTAPPVAGTLSGTQGICTIGTSTFTSTVAGGSWTSSNTSVATINSSTGVITPLTAGTSTMTYTVTGTGGCSNATATLLLTVTAPPVAGTLSGTQSICTTTSGSSFSSTVTGGSWTSSNTSVATINSSTGVITPLTAGTSTMTYTVTGTGGCSNATATLLLTVTAPPVAGTLSGTQGICAGGSTTFASTISGGTWSTSDATIATIGASSGAVTAVAAGTATMTYTVTGTGDCSSTTATATRIVTVNAGPTAIIASNNSPICANSDAIFTLTGTSGATVTYNVNGAANATVVLTGGTGTVTVSGASATQTLNLVSVTDGTCSTTLSGSSIINLGGTTTWNGTSWNNGAPTSAMTAIIAGNYTLSTNIDACSLTVNNSAVVTIPSGYNVTLSGALTVTAPATFTLNNNSNLIQSGTTNPNSGNIVIKRNTEPLYRLDYTLWSSPVTGSQTMINFSPLTVTGRFYEYNTSSDLYNAVANTATFSLAKGYLIRMPNNWIPYSTTATPATWTGIFNNGVPNSGNISFTMSNAGTSYNATGNPYPSTINIASFINANTNNIDGTLWFWRKINDASNATSYSTCTTIGCTLNNNAVYTDYNYISPGQGFFVKAKTGMTTVNFTNSMRAASNTNQFFKNANTTSASTLSRYWLNLSSATNPSIGKKLIAYTPNATLGYDDGLDGKFFGDAQTALLSVINNLEFVIQARPTFDVSDVVPLRFKTNTADTYTVSLDQFDGLFTSQNVYLRDNLLGTVTNLNTSPYSFASAVGTFDGRFDLIYQTASLSNQNNHLTDNQVVVYKNNTDIVINSGVAQMAKVKIFDIRGRLLAEKSNINATEIRMNVGTTNEVLLINITSTEGETVIKKFVN